MTAPVFRSRDLTPEARSARALTEGIVAVKGEIESTSRQVRSAAKQLDAIDEQLDRRIDGLAGQLNRLEARVTAVASQLDSVGALLHQLIGLAGAGSAPTTPRIKRIPPPALTGEHEEETRW